MPARRPGTVKSTLRRPPPETRSPSPAAPRPGVPSPSPARARRSGPGRPEACRSLAAAPWVPGRPPPSASVSPGEAPGLACGRLRGTVMTIAEKADGKKGMNARRPQRHGGHRAARPSTAATSRDGPRAPDPFRRTDGGPSTRATAPVGLERERPLRSHDGPYSNGRPRAGPASPMRPASPPGSRGAGSRPREDMSDDHASPDDAGATIPSYRRAHKEGGTTCSSIAQVRRAGRDVEDGKIHAPEGGRLGGENPGPGRERQAPAAMAGHRAYRAMTACICTR